MSGVKVEDLTQADIHLDLELITKDSDLERPIENAIVNRPGLALAGFFENFGSTRVQVFGKGETSYLYSLDQQTLESCLNNYFSFPLSCLIFTHGGNPPKELLKIAAQKRVPVFTTGHSTHKFTELINDYLDYCFSERTNVHGVLIEVFGIGVLIQGKAGVGKSEAALELIERGHRLIADDAVQVLKRMEAHLYGYTSDILQYNMEIRGLGIIDIRDLYGSGSVRNNKRIDLVIHLEEWDKNVDYDRTGLVEQNEKILDVEIKSLIIPVKPGRNIPVLIETAAKNFRLKQMGIDSARKFNDELHRNLSKGNNGEDD